MRFYRQIADARSVTMPSLALTAIFALASGNIFAASDTPHPRSKAHTQQQHRAAEPEQPAQPEAPAPEARPDTPPAVDPGTSATGKPAATVVDSREASSVLGREVRSAADENMGRIVDMIVDQSGQVRAAIIDFGGFLGVGSRKIAVDWKALKFTPAQDRNRVFLEMTRDQVRAVPEYQEGKPIFVLSAASSSDSARFTTGSAGR